MNILGTQNFWKPRPNKLDRPEKESQILKNQGYISIVVEKVYYDVSPNFFQKLFGGKDKVAITTTAIYKTPGQTDIEAKIVLGTSTVNAKTPSILSTSSVVALNVPSHAEAVELKTTITSIKKDNFERTINILSDKSFQTPLDLAPVNIGQILTVAKLVNRIFTIDPNRIELEGSFAGLISNVAIDNPVQNNQLTEGYLISISNQDKDNSFWKGFDPQLLSYEDQRLLYNGEEVDLTYIVYAIQFKLTRGDNENAAWYKQYQAGINKLDDLLTVFTAKEQMNIKKEALEEWKKGNLLLENDSTYIQREKQAIKKKWFSEIKSVYQEHVAQNSFVDVETLEIATSLLDQPIENTGDGGWESTKSVDRSEENYVDKVFKQIDNDVHAYMDLVKASTSEF